MDTSKLGDTNLYELLDISIDATLNDVRTAYRKKALKCHPDKNPDNPKAAELFHELTKALEILLDENARSAYDKLLKAKAAAKLRHSELDAKRKKFKEDLEQREALHANKFSQKSEEQKLKEEIERLQKEGAKLVREEIQLLQEQVNRDLQKNETLQEDNSLFRIKIEWKSDKNDSENGGYNKQILEKIFQKYGDINALVMSAKNNGQALIEFQDNKAAELAMKIEIGLTKNPLKLKWANKSKRSERKNNLLSGESLVNERDYESLVLRNLRQAEERKKLIEQMQNDSD